MAFFPPSSLETVQCIISGTFSTLLAPSRDDPKACCLLLMSARLLSSLLNWVNDGCDCKEKNTRCYKYARFSVLKITLKIALGETTRQTYQLRQQNVPKTLNALSLISKQRLIFCCMQQSKKTLNLKNYSHKRRPGEQHEFFLSFLPAAFTPQK
jgi:hypothetical protein